MLLGQNFRFGFYSCPPEERMKAIKRAGFDSVMFWWGSEFDRTDAPKEVRFKLAKKEGLEVSTVHFPSTNAHWLWFPGDAGRVYAGQIVEAVEDCARYGIRNLVMHTTRQLTTQEPGPCGLENFKCVLDAAQREGVVIALENTRFLRYNQYIYDNFSSKYLGFCFDTGHANCYTPDEDPLEQFSEYLVTTHIHDNYGKNGSPDGKIAPSGRLDLHNLMGDGNIDFDAIFKRLKKLNVLEFNLESYCFEHSKYWGLSMDEFLKISFMKLKKTLSI